MKARKRIMGVGSSIVALACAAAAQGATRSEDNVFFDNTATGNGDIDFNNLGSGSCGSGNTFSVPGCR